MSPQKDASPFARSYLLYASTIFLSAFLLFVIQPIAGKHILPYFGGSSSVWATSLAFFTGMLFLGYLYVYVLTTSLGGKRQATLHGCVIALVAAATIFGLYSWHSLDPSFDWTIGSTRAPALNVLLALALGIGAPYFLLATTGPLLQYWWGMTVEREADAALGIATSNQSLRSWRSREPYKLYALSNLGSFLALLGFPFFIEPNIPLSRAESLWAILFLVYVAVCGLICVKYLRHVHEEKVALTPPPSRTPISSWLSWIALAALPSYMLVATSTVLTQVVAPVPLLWIIPLALYLITFIIAFRGWGSSMFVPLVLIGAALLAYFYTPGDYFDMPWRIGSYLLLLFFCGLACHARLYQMRPDIQRLPLFYLLLSFGGMLGALIASIGAPLIFADFWEFLFGLALTAAFAGWILSEAFFPRILSGDKIFLTRVICTFGMAALFTTLVNTDDGVTALSSRNFYGPAQVRFYEGVTTLMHGGTLHGMQPTGRELQYVPTSYYVPSSGFGRAMLYELDTRKGKNVRVGVLGLGVGSIASYCREGDSFVFYEIDPRIEKLAQTYFSYLSHCAGSEIRTGDGRLLLEAERREGNLGEYDILVMDAFSDDTIPMHLITLEAVALYAAHLRDTESIIAVHVSNRYLDLAPVVLRIAAQLKFNAMVVRDAGDTSALGSSSQWILLTRSSKAFGATVFAHVDSWLPDIQGTPVWTDDYTSIFTVINLPLPWK